MHSGVAPGQSVTARRLKLYTGVPQRLAFARRFALVVLSLPLPFVKVSIEVFLRKKVYQRALAYVKRKATSRDSIRTNPIPLGYVRKQILESPQALTSQGPYDRVEFVRVTIPVPTIDRDIAQSALVKLGKDSLATKAKARPGASKLIRIIGTKPDVETRVIREKLQSHNSNLRFSCECQYVAFANV